MPVNLSIKNVPDATVARLRRRAQVHHRSLQGELLSILEDTTLREEPLRPSEIVTQIRRKGVKSPAEAVTMIRQDRRGR